MRLAVVVAAVLLHLPFAWATHEDSDGSAQNAEKKPAHVVQPARARAPVDPWVEKLKVLSDHLQMRVILDPGIPKDAQLSAFFDEVISLPPPKEAAPHAILNISSRSAEFKMSQYVYLKVGANAKEIKKILDSIPSEKAFQAKKQAVLDRMERMNRLVGRENFFATREESMNPSQFDVLIATLDRIETQLKKKGKPAKDIAHTAIVPKSTDALAPKDPKLNMTFDPTEIIDDAGNVKNARVMNLFFPLTDAEIQKAFPASRW